MEWYRRVGNWGLIKLVRWRFGGRFTDLCYGYNAFWRDILARFSLDEVDGFEVETSMNIQALRARLRVCEVASREFRRQNGESNLRTIPDGWRVLSTIARLGLSPAAQDGDAPHCERQMEIRRSIPGGRQTRPRLST